MNDASSFGTPARPALWVLFAMVFVALLIANATAVFHQRKWHRQLVPQRLAVAELKRDAQQLADLKELASRKLKQERDEDSVIRSMLKTVRSADDMPIGTGKIMWTTDERWFGDDGRYSLFFSVPEGVHRCEAKFVEVAKGSLDEARYSEVPQENRFNVALKENTAYELRIRHFENSDDGCKFSLQLFDQKEVVLAKREFKSEARYGLLHGVMNNTPCSMFPGGAKEGLGSGTRSVEPFYLTLPCPSESMKGFVIQCLIRTDGPMHADVLKVLNMPCLAQASHFSQLLYEIPNSSRYFRVGRPRPPEGRWPEIYR